MENDGPRRVTSAKRWLHRYFLSFLAAQESKIGWVHRLNVDLLQGCKKGKTAGFDVQELLAICWHLAVRLRRASGENPVLTTSNSGIH